MERLGHGIHNAVRDGSWKPIHLSRRGTPLTHLFFANDLLLLAEATCNQAKTINEILENFCSISGGKVNKEKTQMFFSRNVKQATAKNIAKECGFSVTNNLGKYLGMSLLHNRVTKATYQEIVDKVDQKLSSWNALHLSMAGRVTLAQSVIQAIPIYVMQTTRLPEGIYAKLDKICRRFIWSGAASERKMSLVNWSKVCLPKNRGGLGLKNLSRMNTALLMKIGWNIITKPQSLWIRVLRSKYGLDQYGIPTNLNFKNGSYLWRAVNNIWPHVKNGIRWAVGNGKSVFFWNDWWVPEVYNLRTHVRQQLPLEMENVYVAYMVGPDGSWRWDIFGHLISNKHSLQIAAIKLPISLMVRTNFSGVFTQWKLYYKVCISVSE